MLAQLRGWDVSFGLIDSDQSWDGFAHDTLTITTEDGEWCDNLYNPAHMALAWRVLNWASNNMPGKTGQRQKLFRFIRGTETYGDKMIVSMPPTDAQRAWLDKILSLAIEAGMI